GRRSVSLPGLPHRPLCLSLVPSPRLSAMRPCRGDRVDRKTKAQAPAGALLPDHLHRARRVARVAACPSEKGLRLVAPGKRGRLAGRGRQPETSRGADRLPERAAHLGTATAISSARALRGAGGRLAGRRSALAAPQVSRFFPAANRAGRPFSQPAQRATQTRRTLPADPRLGVATKWVVDVQPVGSGAAALKYLSAYVSRTALGHHRILGDERGKITFKYKDSGERQWRTLTLSAHEFLRRFLQHVLPKGFQRVRYYGWLGPAATVRWQRLLALLDWKPPLLSLAPKPQPLCPRCGLKLCWIGTLERAPPARRRT